MEILLDFIVIFCILGIAGCFCYMYYQYKIICKRRAELTREEEPKPTEKSTPPERKKRETKTEEWIFSFDDGDADSDPVLEVEL